MRKRESRPAEFPRGASSRLHSSAIHASAQTAQVPAIVTDRPDIAESSIVIPVGSVQVENGFTWTRDHRTSAIDLRETLFTGQNPIRRPHISSEMSCHAALPKTHAR